MIEPWSQTYVGIKFDFLNPTIDMIDIQDIARGLSMLCRFSGQCKRFYSVAEHSYHASKLVTKENALFALLHDASEAYISDIVKPLKEQLTTYNIIEKRIQNVIFQKFQISDTRDVAEIKEIDYYLLHYEASKLLRTPSVDNWIDTRCVLPFELKYFSPDGAEHMFLKRFNELYNGGREARGYNQKEQTGKE